MDQLFKLGKGLIKGGGSHGGHHSGGGGGYYDPNYPAQPHGAGGYYPNNQPGYTHGAYAGGYQPDPYHNQPAYGAYSNQPHGGYNTQPHYGPGAHGGGLHGPMAVFKSFDKDGDGQITENGSLNNLNKN
jgi:hypothetical protein